VPLQTTIAILGAGSLANGLAPKLYGAGYTVTEIVGRDSAGSRRHARLLAKQVHARPVTASDAAFDATLLWFCVPDRAIRAAASSLAKRNIGKLKYAFHSSGALSGHELADLKRRGLSVASVHPLMTFVFGATPSLDGVPFVLEGDPAAVRLARSIVRRLGGATYLLPASRKPAYHTWATMTSPLLVAFLVALEQVARKAGLGKKDARRMSLPILRQTIANYAALGPADSFSGPIIRGDAATVAKHLGVLRKDTVARDTYIALANAALRSLPARNRKELRRLLQQTQDSK